MLHCTSAGIGRVTVVAGVLGWAVGVLAGPLDPPSGPIAPTLKTLVEVEPRIAVSAANTPGDGSCLYRITQPGSYYLTGNVNGVLGKSGIIITSSRVTLDLNGFALLGGGIPYDGVEVYFGANDVHIRNGTVSGWGNGLNLTVSNGALIEGVAARDNGAYGIRAGSHAIVRGCSSVTNGVGGIGVDGVVESCVAAGNAGSGIAARIVRSSIARDNEGWGIEVGAGGIVSGCVAVSNALGGINASLRTLVEGCSAMLNVGPGIEATTQCIVRENVCTNNTGARGYGISAASNDNRIEGNNCTGNAWGVHVGGTGNIIVRNTCSGNTVNWYIMAGNAVAPIVNASLNGALINGNSYAGSLGSADGNANFTY